MYGACYFLLLLMGKQMKNPILLVKRKKNASGNKIGQIIMSERKFDYIIITMQHNQAPFSRISFLNLTNH